MHLKTKEMHRIQ